MPLLSILTLSVFAIKLYWDTQMRSEWLYRRVTRLSDATDIMILSKGKSFTHANALDKHFEIS